MNPTIASLAAVSIRIPDHVVHRMFVAETVVLNLQTGQYHGLNPTAGRMLETLEHTGDVTVTVARLAEEFGRPPAEIERDLVEFCRDLLERGLIEVE